MSDLKDLIQLIKRAAVDAVKAAKPVEIHTATITSLSPLSASMEQGLSLPASMLACGEQVRNLQLGDKVILIRKQGGNVYYIMDRVMGV